MAANHNGQIPPCPNDAPEKQLDLAKLELGNAIIANIDSSELIWSVVSKKQDELHRLYREQIVVSELFTRFNLTLRERDYGSVAGFRYNFVQKNRFKEVDKQVQYLLRRLERWETKTDRTGEIVKDFIRDMKAHISSLKACLEAAVVAKCMEDLAQVRIPDLNWIQNTVDPQIDALAEEWDHMKLKPKIEHYIRELDEI